MDRDLYKEGIYLDDGSIILNLRIDDQEIIAFLFSIENENERLITAKKAFKLGIMSMNNALFNGTSQFIKEALKNWQSETMRVISELLSSNKEIILKETSSCVEESISKNITQQIENITKSASERIKEKLEDVQRRIDPANPESWLRILNESVDNVRKEFNPDLEGSYLYKIKNILSEFYGMDGPAYKCIYESFDKAGRALIEPIKDTLDKVHDYVSRIGERLQVGHLQRGLAFERVVLGELLQNIVLITGDEIEHIGSNNRPGDWLIRVYYGGVNNRVNIGNIVIEVKDAERSKDEVRKDLEKAMKEREAEVGILVFARLDQNPYNLSFNVIDKDYSKIVCVWDEEGLNLNFAYQLARLVLVEKYLRKEKSVNWEDFDKQIDEIVSEINSMDNAIDSAKRAKENADKTERSLRELKESLLSKVMRLREFEG